MLFFSPVKPFILHVRFLDGVNDFRMRYWLMKCEPAAYTIDDLRRDKVTRWEGVRNYQARNFMRDRMQVGDPVLFYASNAEPSGVTGLAKIARGGYPDSTPSSPATNTTTRNPTRVSPSGTWSTSNSSRRSRTWSHSRR